MALVTTLAAKMRHFRVVWLARTMIEMISIGRFLVGVPASLSFNNFICRDDDITKQNEARPFQLKQQLLDTYGELTLFTSRPAINRQSAICNRM
jgi:hypothetical protein